MLMDAQSIIEYIRTSEKKTPVKVYVWEKAPVSFPNCKEFPAGGFIAETHPKCPHCGSKLTLPR